MLMRISYGVAQERGSERSKYFIYTPVLALVIQTPCIDTTYLKNFILNFGNSTHTTVVT